MKITVKEGRGKEIAEHAFWLAWKACGGTVGMGVYQDRPNATKEEILANVRHSGDYPGHFKDRSSHIDGDYVFGRMMKTTIKYTKDTVIVPNNAPRPGYQGWCTQYPTYRDLIDAAILDVQ